MSQETSKAELQPGDEGYVSQNQSQINAARAVGNTWTFEGKELQMHVARGEAVVATDILDQDQNKTGTQLLHHFKWEGPEAFVNRENSFKTNLSRVGRRVEQKISTTHLATVNSQFYQDIIHHGELLTMKNGEEVRRNVDLADMLQHAKLYPEAVSEAIETWIDAPVIKRIEQSANFEHLFSVPDKIEVVWRLGDVAAAIFVFEAPPSEARASFDSNVQNVETKRQGDVSTTNIEENFKKKIQYGAAHLLDVKGLAVKTEGRKFEKSMKEEMIAAFNPIWFGMIVDVMHSTFDFMKGSSKNN